MSDVSITRRGFIKGTGAALGATALAPFAAGAVAGEVAAASGQASPLPYADQGLVRLCFNENPYGPSPLALEAIGRESARAHRYGDAAAATELTARVAQYERIDAQQIVLGEVLGTLGLHLGTEGGPGGEFIYSSPGYLALIDAVSRVGGSSVAVPLDAAHGNDLPAITAKVTGATRAIYLVNPHNPTGTVSDNATFKQFLREVSRKTLVIVDEAYLEYTEDFATRSAVDLVREGANVAVFRTFAKIHGLAGLPFGYLLAPAALVAALKREGAGDAEGLGRITMAAAAGALQDTALVERSRQHVAAERAQWHRLFDRLGLEYSRSQANYVFFDARQPQPQLAAALRERGIDIGRAFPPMDHWARISIGLPEENAKARAALQAILGA